MLLAARNIWLQPTERQCMYSNANFAVILLLIAGVLGAVALLFTAPRDNAPSKMEMREALERTLDPLVPSGAAMCGLVEKGSDRSEAIECARNSMARSLAFVAAFQEQGEDSDIWSALVGVGESGELRLLIFDSSPSGEPQRRAEYFVTSHACSGPEFAVSGSPAVTCKLYDEP